MVETRISMAEHLGLNKKDRVLVQFAPTSSYTEGSVEDITADGKMIKLSSKDFNGWINIGSLSYIGKIK